MLIPRLVEIQGRCGYLPKHELSNLARALDIAESRVWDAASAFPSFRLEPEPRATVGVCRDMTCHLRGAPELLGRVRDVAPQGDAVVEEVSCLGRCDVAPVVRVAGAVGGRGHPRYIGRPSPDGSADGQVDAIRACLRGGPGDPDPGPEAVGRASWTLDPYDLANWPEGEAAPAPFAALRAWLGRPPGDLIESLKKAELVGLGGALGRTSKKWHDVFVEAAPRHVVANGDESEPGTFKDREVLLRKPHLVVEGVALAGLVLRAARGFLYIRHEYEAQIEAVDRAIAEAKAAVPEAFATFDLEVFTSPGGYICGEQSALLEVIEGRRAQPRDAFPSLQTNGLFGRPTLVNNVETFAWVPAIALRGPDWYLRGKRRFFSISGDVAAPGVFEASIESTLGQLIDRAGGVRKGLQLKAVAPSGPSGGFCPRHLPADAIRRALEANLPGARKRMPSDADRMARFLASLDGGPVDIRAIPLDGAVWRGSGLMLGAGIVIYGEATGEAKPTRMAEQAANCLEFFGRESCGKCAPCRIGTQKLVRIAGILRGKAVEPQDQALIDRGLDPPAAREAIGGLAAAMTAASICSLGQVAANPLLSFLDHFGGELQAPGPAGAAGPTSPPEADR